MQTSAIAFKEAIKKEQAKAKELENQYNKKMARLGVSLHYVNGSFYRPVLYNTRNAVTCEITLFRIEVISAFVDVRLKKIA